MQSFGKKMICLVEFGLLRITKALNYSFQLCHVVPLFITTALGKDIL